MPNLNAPWRQPPAPIDPALITETLEADVVVVGCAHAGTAAARAAAEAGAAVIAIDQQKEKLFHAVGNDLGHINSKFLAQRGIPHVDEIEFLNDWQLRSNNRSNPKLVMQFARTSGECFDWMIEPLTQEQRDAIVVTHWPGNKNFTGDISGFKFWPGCAEFPGIASLSKVARLNQQEAQKHGARFLFELTARQLSKMGQRVTGVICQKKDGSYIQLNAKKAVILAAGDFSKNAEMVEDLCDEITTLKQPARPSPPRFAVRTAAASVWVSGPVAACLPPPSPPWAAATSSPIRSSAPPPPSGWIGTGTGSATRALGTPFCPGLRVPDCQRAM